MSPSSAGRPLLVSNSVLPFKLKLALNDRVVKEKDFLQDTVRIGRASDNDVILPDKKCSRYHAQIVCEKNGIRLVNISRSSPTLVNGKKVEEDCFLKGGEKITLGKIELTFEPIAPSPSPLKRERESSRKQLPEREKGPVLSPVAPPVTPAPPVLSPSAMPTASPEPFAPTAPAPPAGPATLFLFPLFPLFPLLLPFRQ